MHEDREFIAVIGRFAPFYKYSRLKHGVTPGAKLEKDGTPKCHKVIIQRIVPEPSVSAEQAADEFLRLTDEQK